MSAKAIYEYEQEIQRLREDLALSDDIIRELKRQLDTMAQTYQGRTHYA